jgi:murein DD-endopeptidase MepM/ murein hydrolase activator NlpD
MLVIGVVIRWQVKSITEPLQALRNMVTSVENSSDFSRRIKDIGNDEVGQTAKAFNQLMSAQQLAIAEVNKAVEAIAAGRFDVTIEANLQGDLKTMKDTINLVLLDYEDCSFHPPAIGDVTSNFGFRRWGRRQKFHFGTDIRMEVGDPVYAAFEGVVRIAKRSADYGYVVLIRHNNGLETLYAHFSQLLCYPGQPVIGGNIIGLAGSTGRSTGPHLHFEVRFQGEKIDPATIIHFPSGSLLADTFKVDKGCFKHLYEVQSAKLKAQKTKKIPKYVKARKGDTIVKIAKRYGLSAKKLSKLNGIKTTTKLKTGRNIRTR